MGFREVTRMPRRIPWRSLSRPDPDGRFVCTAGVFVLDRWRYLPRFLLLTLRARREARRSPGVIGYALIPHFRTKTFTEISAFVDRRAMGRFAATPGHAAAANAMRSHLGPGSKLVVTDLYGRDLPPQREDIEAWLEAEPGQGAFDRPSGEVVAGARAHHLPGAHAGPQAAP